MDWAGQKLSERLMQYLLLLAGLVAFVTGYVMHSYKLMLLIYLVGTCITFLLAVPDWPFFNRHPIEWLDPKLANSPRSKVPKVVVTKKGVKGTKR